MHSAGTNSLWVIPDEAGDVPEGVGAGDQTVSYEAREQSGAVHVHEHVHLHSQFNLAYLFYSPPWWEKRGRR